MSDFNLISFNPFSIFQRCLHVTDSLETFYNPHNINSGRDLYIFDKNLNSFVLFCENAFSGTNNEYNASSVYRDLNSDFVYCVSLQYSLSTSDQIRVNVIDYNSREVIESRNLRNISRDFNASSRVFYQCMSKDKRFLYFYSIRSGNIYLYRFDLLTNTSVSRNFTINSDEHVSLFYFDENDDFNILFYNNIDQSYRVSYFEKLSGVVINKGNLSNFDLNIQNKISNKRIISIDSTLNTTNDLIHIKNNKGDEFQVLFNRGNSEEDSVNFSVSSLMKYNIINKEGDLFLENEVDIQYDIPDNLSTLFIDDEGYYYYTINQEIYKSNESNIFNFINEEDDNGDDDNGDDDNGE